MNSPETTLGSDPPICPRISISNVDRVRILLRYMNPYCSESERDQVVRSVHRATGGGADGLALADDWYRRRSDYPGPEAMAIKWRAVTHDPERPEGFGTLLQLVDSHGFDSLELCGTAEPGFEPCEYAVVNEPLTVMNVLVAFSLLGRLKKLNQDIVAQTHLLGTLVLMGQATVLYAAPNTGKTLIFLWLLIEAIRQGRVEPTRVFYVNVDDSLNGLVQKLKLAETYGFHMLAEGYEGFQARNLPYLLDELTERGQAHGVVIVLDTLKKFTDLMDKRTSTEFGKVIRRFVLRGGTCVLLAHTNKRPGADGRPIYAGTSDIVEDVDCAYTLRVISEPGAAERVIEFENLKRRGDVCQRAVYGYSAADGISYEALLASVRPIDDRESSEIEKAAERRTDADLIEAARDCIRSGINTRMALAAAIAQKANCSKRKVFKLLDHYTGTDPHQHCWAFEVKARGAKTYRLLSST